MFKNLHLNPIYKNSKKLNTNSTYKLGVIMDNLTIDIVEKKIDIFDNVNFIYNLYNLSALNQTNILRDKLRQIFDSKLFSYSEKIFDNTRIINFKSYNQFSQTIMLDFCHFMGEYNQFNRLEMYITIKSNHNIGTTDYIFEPFCDMSWNDNLDLFIKNSLVIIHYILNDLLPQYNREIGLL